MREILFRGVAEGHSGFKATRDWVYGYLTEWPR